MTSIYGICSGCLRRYRLSQAEQWRGLGFECEAFNREAWQDTHAEIPPSNVDRQSPDDVSLVVYCALRYEGGAREALHAAKIGGCYRSIRFWQEFAVVFANRLVRRGYELAGVMPAPSSLWGRVRGRLDVSWFAAEAVSRHHRVQRLPVPFASGWHVRKHALSARERGRRGLERMECAARAPIGPRRAGGPYVLLVDDVLTSGETLLRLRRLLPAEGRFLGLALCAAGGRYEVQATDILSR